MTKISHTPNLPSRRRFIAATASMSICHTPASMADTIPDTASVLINAESGEILSATRAEKPHAPASLVKIMTLYGLFDALAAGKLLLSDRIEISDAAAAQLPLRLGLDSGASIAIADAIGAIATRSANDVACAVAERLGHSETRFSAWMNANARKIGLRRTRFSNASGLPGGNQWSTALDMARLGARIRSDHTRYCDWLGRSSYTYLGRNYQAHTTILNAPSVIGAKTGYTAAAGYNLIAWAHRGSTLIVGVVLGERSARQRDDAMVSLLGVSL